MFERIKHGPHAGELVRLKICACAIIREFAAAPRNPYVTGYGKKIPTNIKVRTVDNRWRRVYVAQYSNCGTTYVMHGKARTIVDLPI